MKLEEKHFASYYPYGINIMRHNNKDYILQLTGIDEYGIELLRINSQNEGCVKSRWSDISDNKLVLRNLSDITKEIEYKGQLITPIFYLKNIYPNCPNFFNHLFKKESVWNHCKDNLHKTNIEHCIAQKLIEWHFDFFGLIPKGLAIDKNTL